MIKKYYIALLLFIILCAGALLAFKYYRDPDRITYTSTTMPAIYHEIIAKSDPMKVYGRNNEHIVILEKRLQDNPDDKQLQFNLACEYLYAGKSQKAIDLLEALEKDSAFVNHSKTLIKEGKTTRYDSLESWIALGYLRLGEQLNCINNHSAESCIFPISGGGIHQIKQPVEEAIKRYLVILKENPKDYISQWCLNVAVQAYGSVPDYVPKNLLIDSSLLKSDYDIGKFHDVAMQAGVTNTDLAGGIIADDFDNDGYIDIMSSTIALEGQIKFFHNNGDGTFSDRTKEAGLIGETEGLNLSPCDYNNDGNLDFTINRGAWKGKNGRFPLSLLRNNGNATFTDVTIEAKLLRFYPTQTVEWSDFNCDGFLDLFIGNESGYTSELYVNNKNETFTNVSKQCGIDFKGFVKGANWGDYNNDGFPDLYVSEFGHANHLFKNNGPNKNGVCTFTDVAKQAGVENPIWSFPCWWFDYNNDGWQDLFVSAYRLNVSLNSCNEYLGLPMDSSLMMCMYRNNGDGTFTNVRNENHLGYETFTMGCNYGDLDNDGWLDFYLGIGAPDLRAIFPKRMFRNNEGKFFQDVTFGGGLGQIQKGHAVAFADFDMDGDQDVYSDIGGFFAGDVYQNALYENPGHSNNWIYLRLTGITSNRFGVGAKVKLTFDDGEKLRTTYNVISKGASFGGNPIMLQAGVGKATVIKEIEITWPGKNEKQVFENVAVNKMYRVTEGKNSMDDISMKAFKFPGNLGQMHMSM
ncbi:MAG TPA: CRTAC1 family protein [Chitinophagales bacterium]|nr:CRTAC1 family protein [Chitinophagales bacterium]